MADAAPNPNPNEVSRILEELQAGDPQAARDLLPAVYDELRRAAENRLRNEPAGITLQATGLVHEAYLRLLGGADSWENRRHFFGAAALAMQRILVERARRVGRVKHGGDRQRIALDHVEPAAPAMDADELLALDAALTRLDAEQPQRAQIVRLRYFAGLTIEQTADALGVSPVTVTRHWTCARAWLFDAMQADRNAEGHATDEDSDLP